MHVLSSFACHAGTDEQQWPYRPRPLPTPCRSSRDLSWQQAVLEDGPTLLEQSRRDWPIWQARTLLETLIQHEADKDRSGHDVPAPEPVRPLPLLRLADSLPTCREFDLTAVTMPIGRTLDDVLRLFHSPWVLDSLFPP